ncbi:unnamed protein product [Arctia plantaginis]|nr:unnamed protein product [Arctia plantaginis]
MFITYRYYEGFTSVDDNMGTTEKRFIANITLELVRDARLKTRQLARMRQDHSGYVAYHVGLVVGKIREKYKSMLDIYREAQDHRHERMYANIPGIKHDRVEHYFFFFELVRKYELHIDHLVHVLESIPEEEWPGKDGALTDTFHKTQLPYGRRHSKLDQFGYEIDVIKEQHLKRNLRQKFLLRKMGRPVNASTSQKR